MRVSFDVLTQPWIPVVDAQGRTQEVGIWDALTQAERWKGIQDPSPLVEYSVYRFLIVFLMDALRPQDTEALEDLLDEGCFPKDALDKYIQQCRSEGVTFDLFDEKRPFMQTVYRKEWDKKPIPASKLDETMPHGNNAPHFEHGQHWNGYTPGEAFRYLITSLVFCGKGGRGYYTGLEVEGKGKFPWFTLIQGSTLFETLVCSMTGTNDSRLPFDQPPVLWRYMSEIESGGEIVTLSWLSGMLFPGRRISLIPRPDGRVTQIYYSSGLNCGIKNSWTNPHVTYMTKKDGRKTWKPDAQNHFWMNSTALMDIESRTAPDIIYQFSSIRQREKMIRVMLYGAETEDAKWYQQYRYNRQFPAAIVGDSDCICSANKIIHWSEELGAGLKHALRGREKEVDKKKEMQGVISLSLRNQAVDEFYHECEELFWAYLNFLPELDDMDEPEHQMMEQMIICAERRFQQVFSQADLRGEALVHLFKYKKMYLDSVYDRLRKGDATDNV